MDINEALLQQEAEKAWEVVRETLKPSETRMGDMMRDVAKAAFVNGYKAASRKVMA